MRKLRERIISLVLLAVLLVGFIPPMQVQAADGGKGGLKISAPSDGGTIDGTANVTVKWNAYSGAHHYWITVKDTVSGKKLIDEECSGTSYKIYASDEIFSVNGRKYKIYVAAMDANDTVLNGTAAWQAIYVTNSIEDDPDYSDPLINAVTAKDDAGVKKTSFRHYENITFSTKASDDVGLHRVRMYIDGERVASKSVNGAKEYTIKYEIDDLDIGTHEVFVEAIDLAGNINETPSIVVTVTAWYEMDVETIDTNGSQTTNSIMLKGELMLDGDWSQADVGFEYKPYGGSAITLTMYRAYVDGEIFSAPASDLKPNTKYMYRAYAVLYGKPESKIYGDWITIITEDDESLLPEVETLEPEAIGSNCATLVGEMISTGGKKVTTQYGFVLYFKSGTTTTYNVGSGTTAKEFSYDLTQLDYDHEYSYKAFAKNEYGTVYGERIYFTTDELETIQLQAPEVVEDNIVVEIGDVISFKWGAVENATEYTVYVWDSDGKQVASSVDQKSCEYLYAFEETGSYCVQIYATNAASEVYTQSLPETVNVLVEEKEIILGDVNCDGSVTITDRFIFNRYLAGMDGYTVDVPNADIDGDGVITQVDCTYLSRHLANWEGYSDLNNFQKELIVEKQEVVVTPEVRIYDAFGNDLNDTTMEMGYTAFSGKTVYVETNVQISAWNDGSNAFVLDWVDCQYVDGKSVITYALRGTKNPLSAARKGEIRIYRTLEKENYKLTANSEKLLSFTIQQQANPNVTAQVPSIFKPQSGLSNPYENLPRYLKGYQLADQVEKNHVSDSNLWLSISIALSEGFVGSLEAMVKDKIVPNSYEKEQYKEAILYVLSNVPDSTEVWWMGVSEAAKEYADMGLEGTQIAASLVKDLEKSGAIGSFAGKIDSLFENTVVSGGLTFAQKFTERELAVFKLQIYGKLAYFDLLLEEAEGIDPVLTKAIEELKEEYLHSAITTLKNIGISALEASVSVGADWLTKYCGEKILKGSVARVFASVMAGVSIADFARGVLVKITPIEKYAKEAMNLVAVKCIEALAACAYLKTAENAKAQGDALTIAQWRELVNSFDLMRACLISRNLSAKEVDGRAEVVEQLEDEIEELKLLSLDTLTSDWKSEHYYEKFFTKPVLDEEAAWYFDLMVDNGNGYGIASRYDYLTTGEKQLVWEIAQWMNDLAVNFEPETDGLYYVRVYETANGQGPAMIIESGSGESLLITCGRKEKGSRKYVPLAEPLTRSLTSHVLQGGQINLTTISPQGYVTTISESMNKLVKYMAVNQSGVNKMLNEYVYELYQREVASDWRGVLRETVIAKMVSQIMYKQTDDYETVIKSTIKDYKPEYVS